ncbi:MAG: alpha/beta hydrolase [Gemmataceae bacterium]
MHRLLAVLAVTTAPLPAAEPAATARPAVAKRYDLTYATVDGVKLQLDYAAPATGGPHPCVVCLHGGAWKAGSRKDLSRTTPLWNDFGTGDGSLIEALAARGFAAVSVSYRLAPKCKFPGQIQDAKTAVRYLRENASQLNIDPDRIAAMGFSAGGHIAALLGTATDVPEFEGEMYKNRSSKVACVVNFFGPADLCLYCDTPGIEAGFMVPLLGCKSCDGIAPYKKASPIEHVSADDPPFLHIHGTADPIVPVIHTERLHARMKAAGVKTEFIPVPGKGHGWFGPEAVASTEAAVKFLAANLKGK